MKTLRFSTLAACVVCLLPGVHAQEVNEILVRDQVTAELPAGVRLADLAFSAHGRPVKKVRATVTVTATQNLYAAVELRPTLHSAATELSEDLRNSAPAPLKVLKVVLAKGHPAEPLELEFKATPAADALGLELLDSEAFLGLGKPRSRFPAGLLAEDSPEGRREIAAWEEAVKNYNAKVALTDKRARTDRNKDLFVTVLDKGLGAYQEITRRQDSGAGENPGGPLEAFQGLLGSVTQTGPATQEPQPNTPAATPAPAPATEAVPTPLGAIPTPARVEAAPLMRIEQRLSPFVGVLFKRQRKPSR